MPEPRDADAIRRIHELDQAGAALDAVARLIATYRRALLREGVPRAAATALAAAMQRELLALVHLPER